MLGYTSPRVCLVCSVKSKSEKRRLPREPPYRLVTTNRRDKISPDPEVLADEVALALAVIDEPPETSNFWGLPIRLETGCEPGDRALIRGTFVPFVEHGEVVGAGLVAGHGLPALAAQEIGCRGECIGR